MSKSARVLTLVVGCAVALLMFLMLTLDAARACGADETIAPSGSAASLAGETLGSLICGGD